MRQTSLAKEYFNLCNIGQNISYSLRYLAEQVRFYFELKLLLSMWAVYIYTIQKLY